MKRIGFVVLAFLISPTAGTAAGESRPVKSARSRQPRFLELLPKQATIALQKAGNSASFDIEIRKLGQNDKNDELIYVVVGHGPDYVILRRGKRNVYLPKHSIRSITGTPVNPLNTLVTRRFFRMPLKEFVGEIAKIAGAEIRIDRDALKNAGYTLNMPQTVVVRNTPVEQLLAELCQRYAGLVLTKPGDHYLITSRKFALKRGETIRELMAPAKLPPKK